MTHDSPHRAALLQAFAHLGALGAEADLSDAQTPLDQWVAVLRHLMKRYGDVGPAVSQNGIRITPVLAGGVPAEWVQAQGANPAHRLVYLHGGGWAGGAPQDYRGLSATLARLSGASVLMVDYRLAPEHRFPAGLDDCVTALDWAANHGPDGAGAADWLTVAGDSAGGALAASTVFDAITRGQRVPDRLALIAGTLDNLPYPDRVGLEDPVGLPDSLAAAIATYLGPNDVAQNPRVSPLFIPTDVLAKFPPTLQQASNIETLLFDTRRFAARLESAGVRSALSIWPDLPHVWHAFLGLFPEAHEALAEIADFLRPRPRRV